MIIYSMIPSLLPAHEMTSRSLHMRHVADHNIILFAYIHSNSLCYWQLPLMQLRNKRPLIDGPIQVEWNDGNQGPHTLSP